MDAELKRDQLELIVQDTHRIAGQAEVLLADSKTLADRAVNANLLRLQQAVDRLRGSIWRARRRAAQGADHNQAERSQEPALVEKVLAIFDRG